MGKSFEKFHRNTEKIKELCDECASSCAHIFQKKDGPESLIAVSTK